MQRLKSSWTFLLFCCSVALCAEIRLPVHEEAKSLSKGNIDAEWAYSGNKLNIADENNDDFYGSNDSGEKQNAERDNNEHARFKRSHGYLDIDSGYGSRLAAGSNLANDYLALQRVFGNGGPGKRSGYELYGLPQMPLKRDYGYGSRLRAGGNIARSLLAGNSLYGVFGPGRKRQQELSNEELTLSGLEKGEKDAVLDLQKRRFVTDSGYGSRIDAANRVASDLSAIHDVFGVYGPGKR